MRDLLRAEGRIPREEARFERELRRHRATAGKLVGEIAHLVECGPDAHAVASLAHALAKAAEAQRAASEALLGLANVRLARVLAAVEVDEGDSAEETIQ